MYISQESGVFVSGLLEVLQRGFASNGNRGVFHAAGGGWDSSIQFLWSLQKRGGAQARSPVLLCLRCCTNWARYRGRWRLIAFCDSRTWRCTRPQMQLRPRTREVLVATAPNRPNSPVALCGARVAFGKLGIQEHVVPTKQGQTCCHTPDGGGQRPAQPQHHARVVRRALHSPYDGCQKHGFNGETSFSFFRFLEALACQLGLQVAACHYGGCVDSVDSGDFCNSCDSGDSGVSGDSVDSCDSCDSCDSLRLLRLL